MELMLEMGDRVDIQIHHPINPEGPRIFHAQVMNMDSEFYYISAPEIRGIEYPVRIGQKADLSFYRDEGIYYLTVAFVKKIQDENAALYQISIISQLRRTQRREHHRFKCEMTGMLKSLVSEKSCEIIIKDISAGGVSAISPQPFYLDERTECQLFFDEDVASVSARIVRTTRIGKEKRYRLGLQFENVCEEKQDQIIAFISRKQEELSDQKNF
ncbi:MAG: flagellar brake protein [Bacillota bacterium]|nr:flagellar brake protein [Bacillota bacterium]MDW7676069.1 flagellar brake protein [Bacillota bacterium]